MSPQERDLRKLRGYARELGLKLVRRPYNRYTGQAEYDDSRRTITLFGRATKTQQIMSLLHELGHHLDFLQKKNTSEVDKAYILLNRGPMVGFRLDMPKKYRKTILQVEKSGIKYMSRIHKKLKLEIPIELVKAQQHLDVFDYQFFYENGRFPTYKEITGV